MGQMDAKAANTCEHLDLQVIDRHWQVKRGWHPARHPCHPLICLEIYWSRLLYSPDSNSVHILAGDDGKIGLSRARR